MLKGIGAHMERPQQQQHLVAPADGQAFDGQSSASQQRLVVNSNLVSFSIVADPRYTIKVDLSAPVELVFKHIEPLAGWQLSASPLCVYWDTSTR